MEKADSLERQKYHEWLERFKAYLAINSVIYDIGKSAKYDYADMFKNYNYKTIDKDANKNPDILQDMEVPLGLYSMINSADAVICNGVVEQCENPFKLLGMIDVVLKDSGYLLFGTVLTGYPVYDNDRIRFTAFGIENALKKYEIIDKEIIHREGIKDPTYMFLIVKKERKNVISD